MLCKNVKANGFVLRQTPESDYSHFEGPWEELEQMVLENFQNRTGVLEIPGGCCCQVPVEPERFRTAEVFLEEGDKLVGVYEARAQGEEPRKQIKVHRSRKPEAVVANIAIYQSSALAEDEHATPVLDPSDLGNWEIVSVNAGLFVLDSHHKEPQMALETLLANQCKVSGGTPRKFSSAEAELEAIKKSFLYWRNKAMVTLKS